MKPAGNRAEQLTSRINNPSNPSNPSPSAGKDFHLGKFQLPLDRPHIMGVLNLTADSFYDGGRWLKPKAAIAQAERMAEEGAAIIDIGAESTRPGAKPVDPQTEQERVLSVLRILKDRLALPISVDTSNPELMLAAAREGAALINDVRALSRPGALQAAATAVQEEGVAVCLMHIQGEPGTMQKNPTYKKYKDVVAEVKQFLKQRQQAAVKAGIPAQQIILDPGFGFGKKFEHNQELLRRLDELSGIGGSPLLIGISRKSFLGEITGREVQDRLSATIAATALAASKGAWIIRVHDVKENSDALKLFSAIA